MTPHELPGFNALAGKSLLDARGAIRTKVVRLHEVSRLRTSRKGLMFGAFTQGIAQRLSDGDDNGLLHD
jgi:hypothetical protein